MEDITFEPAVIHPDYCAFSLYGINAKWKSKGTHRKVFKLDGGSKTYQKIVGFTRNGAYERARNIADTLNKWITDPNYGEEELNALSDWLGYIAPTGDVTNLLAAYRLLE
jgi:hypothetical protein